MNILLLNQFYPPDVAPTGQFLHDFAVELAGMGHKVTVFCSKGSYDGGAQFPEEEICDGVRIRRLRALGFGRRNHLGKILDYASFYGLLGAKLLMGREQFDAIISLTTPPYVGLLGAFASWARGSRAIHWIMDLYPDVMTAHGMLNGRFGAIGDAILKCLTSLQLKSSTATIALGPHMARKVEAYSNGSTCWVPLWHEPSLAPWPVEQVPLRAERGWGSNECVFMYSGNMGLGHRFQEFLEVSRRLGPQGPVWAFAGGGMRRPEIEAFARANPDARIQMLPYVPRERLRESLCSADVHLVSLDSRWQGLMVPSKLASIFGIGKPTIFVGQDDNELAYWIRESGAGWVVGENDIEGLLQAVREAMDPQVRRQRGEAARTYAELNFDPNKNCRQMVRLIEACVGGVAVEKEDHVTPFTDKELVVSEK